MSVNQHSCKMSKEEIEASMCEMCSKEDQGEPLESPQNSKKSCCSNKAVHLRLDTDATSTKAQFTPQPIISEPLVDILLESAWVNAEADGPTQIEALPAFPLSEEHTVLRV